MLVTQDNIAGNELSRTGDLAPANVRLAQAGVRIERRSLLRRVGAGEVVVGDRYTGVDRVLPCVGARRLRLPPPHRPPARAHRPRPGTASPRGPSTRPSSRPAASP